eukprot:Opistho-2@71963
MSKYALENVWLERVPAKFMDAVMGLRRQRSTNTLPPTFFEAVNTDSELMARAIAVWAACAEVPDVAHPLYVAPFYDAEETRTSRDYYKTGCHFCRAKPQTTATT